MSIRRKKRHIVLKLFLVLLLAALVCVLLFKDQIKSYVTKKAASVIAEKLIEEKLSSEIELPDGLDVSSIVESMDDEDAATVTEIVEENMSDENVSAVTSYLSSGDMSGLKQYVKDTLSSEDTAEIQEIYDKYKDQYAEEIQAYQDQLQNE